MQNYWDGIVGQVNLKQYFDSLLTNRHLPQAFIISGPRGTGKDFIAARLAAVLNSRETFSIPDLPFQQLYIKYIFALPRGKGEESNDDPLEKITQAQYNEVISSLNQKNKNPYARIEIEGANDIRINSIRDITRFLSLTSGYINHKTVIISNAEFMNEDSQNALLKQLEEPPPETTFILTSSSPGTLRETIRSRCWQLNTVPFSTDDIQYILENFFKADNQTAKSIAPFCDGSIYSAESLIDIDIERLKSTTVEFLRYSLANHYHTAMTFIEENIEGEDDSRLLLFLKMIAYWIADAQKYKAGLTNLYFNDYEETFRKFHSRYTIHSYNECIRKIEQYGIWYMHNNLNVKILFLNLIHHLASITNPAYGK